MRKGSKFNLDLIKQIKEAQEHIYIEDSRHLVETRCRKAELSNLLTDTNIAFQKQKRYYRFIMEIFSAYKIAFNKTKGKFKGTEEITIPDLSFFNQITKKDINISEKKMKIPSLYELAIYVFQSSAAESTSKKGKVKAQLPDDKIDALTFSMLPSYFHFFWSNFSIVKFIHFFFLISKRTSTFTDEQYDQLARVAFLTPSFRLYCEIALQPIFSKFLDAFQKSKGKQSAVEALSKQQDLYNILTHYSYLIPKAFFVVTQCSSNIVRTLYDSFFNIALQSPITAKLYGLFHFSQSPTFQFLEIMRNLLSPDKGVVSAIFTKMFTHSFSYQYVKHFYSNFEIVYKERGEEFLAKIHKELSGSEIFHNDDDDNEDAGNYDMDSYHDGIVRDPLTAGELNQYQFDKITSLFDLPDLQNCPEIFQPLFLTETDLNLIKFFHKTIDTFSTAKNERCYRVFAETETQISDIYQGSEPTMSDGLFAPQMRHILQDSDPLPEFKTMPEGCDNLADFIKEYLVKRGDIRTLPRRQSNFEKLLIFGAGTFDLHVAQSLSKVVMFRRKNIMALSAYASVKRKAEVLDSSGKDSRKSMKLLFLQNSDLMASLNPPHPSNDYIKNPALIVSDFPVFCAAVRNDSKYDTITDSKYFFKILLHKLMIKMDMNTYSNSRNDSMKKKKQTLKDLDEYYDDNLQNNKKLIIDYSNSVFQPKHFDKFDACTYAIRYIDCYQFNYYHEGYRNDPKNPQNNFAQFAQQMNLAQNEMNDIYPHPFSVEILAQVCNMIIDAFEESQLLRKCDLLSRAFTQMLTEMVKYYPPNESVLGSDITSHMHTIVLMKINPPQLATNYAYITDMVNQYENMTEIFGGYSSSFALFWRYIREIVENAENSSPPKIKFEDFLAVDQLT